MSSAHFVRACLITNPKSGKGGIDLAPILPILTAHGWNVDVRQKRHGGHATELAEQAVKDGFDVVVACGGDGTVGEVVEGVVGTDVAVGVLPGGTANLWAHEIGVSMDLEEAARQLVGAQRRRVDVGHLTINGGHGQHFLLMAGLGLDAEVLSRLSKTWKGRVGMLAYLPAIGRALPKARPFSADIDLDGISRQADTLQIVLGNTRRYASVTSLTPSALVNDGKLDVCILTPATPISATQQLSTLILRKRPSTYASINDRAGRITVRATEIIPLQSDGGRVKQKKIAVLDDGVTYEFSVRAQVLTVLTPRTYDGAMFQGHTGIESEPDSPVTTRHKPGKSWYRVLSVGVDTVSAARERDGRVTTIKINKKTQFETTAGEEAPNSPFLSNLSEGRRIQVKGKKTRQKRVLVASRIRAG